MNKQQLANKIWESANKMRSKIEANEYKDYILGFIFYKYLSDKEVKFLKDEGYDDELLKPLLRKMRKRSSIFKRILDILLAIMIFFQRGSIWARTLA